MLRACLQRKAEPGFAPRTGLSILQGQRAAVRLGDLAAENQPDAGALGLGGEKGDEQVRAVREAWPVVLDRYLQICSPLSPAYLHPASGFQRRVGGIL